MQARSKDTNCQLAAREANINEVDLKLRLLTEDSVVVSDSKKQLTARDTQIAAVKEPYGNLNKSLA